MGDEGGYRAALGLLLAAGMAIGLPHRLRAWRAGGNVSRRGEGPWILFGLRLSALVWFGGVLAYLVDPGSMAWASLPLPAWTRWSGLAAGVAALGLMHWMFRSLGLNLTDTVATRPGATLVTTGPYRWVRHPMYAGLVLLFAAGSLLTANVFLAAAGLVTLAFLAARTPIEEANLIARFGSDYLAYRARTGAILPRRPVRPAEPEGPARVGAG